MTPIREQWTGCYDDSWKRLIVDEAFAHPAKFSRGLIRRIYRHALERGYLRPGDTVVDPFGGVALGALDAMQAGVRWAGCELEERFVALARQNLALWQRHGLEGAEIHQGDSRRLCEVLGAADCVIGSQPFSPLASQPPAVKGTGADNCRSNWKDERPDGYGTTPGQLGGMRAGTVDAVIGSPPFAECDLDRGQSKVEWESKRQAARGRDPQGAGHLGSCAGYGQTPGNLGNLPSGNLADAIVSSPPFEASLSSGETAADMKARWKDCKLGGSCGQSYGVSDGNIGNETGETFWQASREIVQQCYQILKPGGVAIWVCKDFVRKGARVPFSADWLRLCESCGFVPVEWIKASLVKEQRHAGLFGEDITKKKERKSFFRRLAEAKGSPAIDHEDVLIVRAEKRQKELLT